MLCCRGITRGSPLPEEYIPLGWSQITGQPYLDSDQLLSGFNSHLYCQKVGSHTLSAFVLPAQTLLHYKQDAAPDVTSKLQAKSGSEGALVLNNALTATVCIDLERVIGSTDLIEQSRGVIQIYMLTLAY